MNKKQKTILISIITAIFLIISFILIFSLSSKDEKPVDPSPKPTDVTDVLINGEDTVIPDTPIKEGVVDKEIEKEPIVNPDRSEETEVKDAFLDEIVQEITPQSDNIANFYNQWVLNEVLEADYAVHWGYFWTLDRVLHPETKSPMQYILSLPMSYEEDANEKKPVVLYLYDCFLKEYPNILSDGKLGEVKNILDIPKEGLYIIGENDTDFASLYIFPPNEDIHFVTVTLIVTQKDYQLVRGVDMNLNAEIDKLIDILTPLERREELDIVIYNGGQYLPENPVKPLDPNDPNLTPDQITLLRMLGIPYTPTETESPESENPTE